MADEKPKPFFDEDKRKKVLEWINTKTNGGFVCECCQTKSWALSEDLVSPPVFAGGFVIGGTAYPSVLAICSNCGNTKFFNVAMMGIFKQPEPPKEEEKKGGENGQ